MPATSTSVKLLSNKLKQLTCGFSAKFSDLLARVYFRVELEALAYPCFRVHGSKQCPAEPQYIPNICQLKKQATNKSRDERPLNCFLSTHHCLIDLVKLTPVVIGAWLKPNIDSIEISKKFQMSVLIMAYKKGILTVT